MKQVAKFEKVSYDQFKEDWIKQFGSIPTGFTEMYYNIKLPKRSTYGSIGYDFFTPIEINLLPNQDIVIPTGVRCRMNNEYGLIICPRSGLGFKYYERLANTVGVIDSDYYYSDNEGHIMVKIRNDSNKDMKVDVDKGFVQGIFLSYGITEDDDNDSKQTRNGGFGSTTQKG